MHILARTMRHRSLVLLPQTIVRPHLQVKEMTLQEQLLCNVLLRLKHISNSNLESESQPTLALDPFPFIRPGFRPLEASMALN